jgi:arylsulfatase A-like enzyme
MPFIVRWPGHVPAGRTDETDVLSGTDMLPTLCAVAGADVPAEVKSKINGQDVSDAIFEKGQVVRKAPLFFEYGRVGSKTFAYPRDPNDHSPHLAVREGKWKLLINPDGSDAQLYDVVADRSEGINRATENADVTRKLTDEVIAWKKTLP